MEYYRLFLYIFFGVLPSLIWLFYYLQKDMHPEPKKMIVKVFMWGCLITIPVFFTQIGLEKLLDMSKISDFSRFAADVLRWFFVIAFTEEIFKYLVAKMRTFNNMHLDEPLDVMLYMVVAALGFTAVENILYLFSPVTNTSFEEIIKTTLVVSIIRFIGATFLHTLCSALFGYFIAKSFYRPKNKWILFSTGLFLATLLHGAYDFSIMTLDSPFNFALPIIVILGLAIFIISEFDKIKKLKSICIV